MARSTRVEVVGPLVLELTVDKLVEEIYCG